MKAYQTSQQLGKVMQQYNNTVLPTPNPAPQHQTIWDLLPTHFPLRKFQALKVRQSEFSEHLSPKFDCVSFLSIIESPIKFPHNSSQFLHLKFHYSCLIS